MKKNKIIEFLNDTANGNYSVEIANKMSGNVKRMPHNHINVLYMLRELMGDKCKNYLEIGVYYGASFILVHARDFLRLIRHLNDLCCFFGPAFHSFLAHVLLSLLFGFLLR